MKNNDYIKCPVCGNGNFEGGLCPVCGFDESRDYGSYLTLGDIPGNAVTVSLQKSEYKGSMEEQLKSALEQIRKINLLMEEQNRRIDALEKICGSLQQNKSAAALKTEVKKIQDKPETGNLQAELRKQLSAVAMGKQKNITFGSYMQGGNDEKTPIEWQVLKRESGKALLVSKYVLDLKAYNEKSEKAADMTWEKCTLRGWLNKDFYEAAFSPREQKFIQERTVIAGSNPKYHTNVGRSVQDKIFLLSIKEAQKYFSSADQSKCVPTDYAIRQGIWTSKNNFKNEKATCWWWLRSPGRNGNAASYVHDSGSIYLYGLGVSNSGGVRPALWINSDVTE